MAAAAAQGVPQADRLRDRRPQERRAGGYGGALTAGLFLEEFVGDIPWAHLDIAGPARAGSDDGYLVKGGTGFGVRTLVELVESFEPPSDAGHDGKAGSGRGGRARKTAAPAKKPAKKAVAKKAVVKKGTRG